MERTPSDAAEHEVKINAVLAGPPSEDGWWYYETSGTPQSDTPGIPADTVRQLIVTYREAGWIVDEHWGGSGSGSVRVDWLRFREKDIRKQELRDAHRRLPFTLAAWLSDLNVATVMVLCRERGGDTELQNAIKRIEDAMVVDEPPSVQRWIRAVRAYERRREEAKEGSGDGG